MTGNGGCGGGGESSTKSKRTSSTKRKKVAKGRTAAAATGVATKAKRKYTKRTVAAGEKKNKKTMMKKPPPQKSLASTTATATATATVPRTEAIPNVPNETVAYLRDGNTSPPSSHSVEADLQEKTRLFSLSNRKEKDVDAVHNAKNADMNMDLDMDMNLDMDMDMEMNFDMDMDMNVNVNMNVNENENTSSLKKHPSAAAEMKENYVYPVNQSIKKYFKENRAWFEGTVISYNSETSLYKVEYEDGDQEELEHSEIDTKPLPSKPAYDLGMKFERFFLSKQTDENVGWLVGRIKNKFYWTPHKGNGKKRNNRKQRWRYRVEYSDGDSEDLEEFEIKEAINESSKRKRGRGRNKKSPPPQRTQTMKSNRKKQTGGRGNKESASEESSSSESSSESDSSDDDHSSMDEEELERRRTIPHWTGKEHNQFINGSRNYGYGNLKEIDEANCIPSRTYEQLVRYWRWYVNDLTKDKGLVLNYSGKGNINGLVGKEWEWSDDDDDDDDEDDDDEDDEGEDEDEEDDDEDDDNKEKEEEEEVELEEEKRYQQEVKQEAVVTVRKPSKSKWTQKEHARIIEGMSRYGTDRKKIAALMKPRSHGAVSSYISTNWIELLKETKKYNIVHNVKANVGLDVELDLKKNATATDNNDELEEQEQEQRNTKKREPRLDFEADVGLDVELDLKKDDESESEEEQQDLKEDDESETEEEEEEEQYRTPWSKKEHERVVKGISRYGKDIKKLSDLMKTRSYGGVVKYVGRNWIKLLEESKKYIVDDESEEEQKQPTHPDYRAPYTRKEQITLAKGILQYGKDDIDKLATLLPLRKGKSVSMYIQRNYKRNKTLFELCKKYEGEEFSLPNNNDAIDEHANSDEEKEEEDNDSGAAQAGVQTTGEHETGDEEEGNDSGTVRTGVWTTEEHELCSESLISHGSSYKTMSTFMKTRTPEQIKSYFNRNKHKLLRDSSKYRSQQEDDNKEEDKVKNDETNKKKIKVGYWSVDEHERCAESLILHGSSYESMSEFVKTRSPNQVKDYYKRKKAKLFRDSRKYKLRYEDHEEEEDEDDVKMEVEEEEDDDDDDEEDDREAKEDDEEDGKVNIEDMNNTRMKVGAWSVDEHERCAESLISHGLSYESMSKFVGTRTPSQITKYYARKKRKLVQDSKKYIVQSDESEVRKHHSSEVKKYAKIRNRRKSAPPPTTTSSSRRGLQQTGRLTPVLATTGKPQPNNPGKLANVQSDCKNCDEEDEGYDEEEDEDDVKIVDEKDDVKMEVDDDDDDDDDDDGNNNDNDEAVVEEEDGDEEVQLKEIKGKEEDEEDADNDDGEDQEDDVKIVVEVVIEEEDDDNHEAVVEEEKESDEENQGKEIREEDKEDDEGKNQEDDVKMEAEVDLEEEEEKEEEEDNDDNDRAAAEDDDNNDDEEEDQGKKGKVKEESTAVQEYSRHNWTRGEQEKLAEAFAVYGPPKSHKDYIQLSRFIKSRVAGGIKGYLQTRGPHLEFIKKASKKYKNGKKSTTIGTESMPWTDEEHGKICEGYALYDNDYKLIEGYIQTRTATQIEKMLRTNKGQFNDESKFNLGSLSKLPVELYHVLNIAPHEGFDHIISWNWDEENCKSFKIHDKDQFENKVWPNYSSSANFGRERHKVDRFYGLLKHFRFALRHTDGSYYNDMFCKGNIKECIELSRKVFNSKKNINKKKQKQKR